MKTKELENVPDEAQTDLAHRHAESDAQESPQDASGVFGAAPCSLPAVDADSDWTPPIMGDF